MIEGVRVLRRGGADGPISVEEAKRAAIDNAPDLAEPIPHDERGKKGGRGRKLFPMEIAFQAEETTQPTSPPASSVTPRR